MTFPPFYKTSAKDKIKQTWNENPIGVAIVATALLTAAGKLLDSVGALISRRAYAQQVKDRSKK